jgi:uncharacterized protein YkwD
MRRVLAPLVVAATLVGIVASDDVGAEFTSGQISVSATAGDLMAAERIDPPGPDLAQRSLKILELVNIERGRHGLPPMAHNDQLAQAAQLHSEEQALYQEMSHTGKDGSNPGDRIARTGYVFRSWGENVAFGYGSAQSVMNAWMDSPGHRANILSSNTEIGLGLAFSSTGAPYYTQVFATPR